MAVTDFQALTSIRPGLANFTTGAANVLTEVILGRGALISFFPRGAPAKLCWGPTFTDGGALGVGAYLTLPQDTWTEVNVACFPLLGNVAITSVFVTTAAGATVIEAAREMAGET